MEPKDYVAATALIISFISLGVSFRTAGFSRRVKQAELRASILAKVSEAFEMYEHVSKVPINSALEVYETIFHSINKVCDTCRSYEERIASVNARYLAKWASQKV